jgi:hypothetical protein
MVTPAGMRMPLSASGTLTVTGLEATWSLRSPAATDRAPSLRVLAGGAGLTALASPWLHDTQWSGLAQRTLWSLLAVWVLVAAWRLHSATATGTDA